MRRGGGVRLLLMTQPADAPGPVGASAAAHL